MCAARRCLLGLFGVLYRHLFRAPLLFVLLNQGRAFLHSRRLLLHLRCMVSINELL